MFIDAMGLILAENRKISLGELTQKRALAALPFAGRYRLIDFMLSNLVNTGVSSVGVVTFNKYRSLMDHLGSGKAWDLSRKDRGLFILPPNIQSDSPASSGDIGDMTAVLDLLRTSHWTHVILCGANNVFTTTFDEFYKKHVSSGADVTMLYNQDGQESNRVSTILQTDRSGWVKEILVGPENRTGGKVFLGVMVMRRQLLIELLSDAIARGEHDFSVDLILRKHTHLRILAQLFEGVCLKIHSIESYFAATMQILEKPVRKALFWSDLPVYTKVKDEAPSLYCCGCEVSNSMISDGCRIYGKVEDSMIFRAVTIGSRTSIKSCIVMQDSYISEGCELETVIREKACFRRPGVKRVAQPAYPVVIGKGAVV